MKCQIVLPGLSWSAICSLCTAQYYSFSPSYPSLPALSIPLSSTSTCSSTLVSPLGSASYDQSADSSPFLSPSSVSTTITPSSVSESSSTTAFTSASSTGSILSTTLTTSLPISSTAPFTVSTSSITSSTALVSTSPSYSSYVSTSSSTSTSAGYAEPNPTGYGYKSLYEALTEAGCSNWRDFIHGNPILWALYTSENVKTVYAPSDEYFTNTNTTLHRRGAAGEQEGLLHSVRDENDVAHASAPPGTVEPTNDDGANLNGNNQSVVTGPPNSKNGASLSRRWMHSPQNNLPSLYRVASGLGNIVNVIKGDIRDDGGLIQVTDGLFTIPQLLSQTAEAKGHTIFDNLTRQAGLCDTFDHTPSVTVFIPTNDAFARTDQTSCGPGTAGLLESHIVTSGQVGYSPRLLSGQTMQAKNGASLNITVSGQDYYVNGARIIQSNLVLDNGVAHVVDSVLTSTTPRSSLMSVNSGSHADTGRAIQFLLVVMAVISCLF